MAEDNMYDNEFYDMVLKLKKEFEDEMSTTNFDMNDATIGEVSVNMMNVPITEGEVEKVLSHVKYGKAIGIDNPTNEVIKHEKTKRLLTRFCNVCFTKNNIPSIWRKAIIMPILKGHGEDRHIPIHYCGISLLSNLYKIYSSIRNCHLSKNLESSGLLADEPNGFRNLRACIDHLFAITTIVRNRKSRGGSTFCYFVDMRKAFDLLDRDCLLYKLHHAGVTGNMYRAIASIYCNTISCVKLHNLYTPWFNVTACVRQGDALSPTLFPLYINDLVTNVIDTNILC